MTSISPYLFFGGRCEEALAFYETALGTKVDMIMRFSESPDPVPEGLLQPGFENKVMHATFQVGQTQVMASDGCGQSTPFGGFSLTLNVTSETEAQQLFKALSDGGQVQMPLTPTFWSPCYGMLTDRFGISWMINVLAPASGA